MKYISFSEGGLVLSDKNKAPKIFVDTKDRSVIRAAQDLCYDIEQVTGTKAEAADDFLTADIVVQIVPNGEYESFEISIDKNKLYIKGSDKRGAIYGIYDVSQSIGVSPWYWWADVETEKHDKIFVTLKEPYYSKEPSVKYRGIFINDEENFSKWALSLGDLDYVELYKRVYELLLRLKANILWPAMHLCSPHFHKNSRNAQNALEYGIMIGTSHCEQMLRNNQFEYFPFEKRWIEENPDKPVYKLHLRDAKEPCAYVWTDQNPQTGEFVYNKELVCDYWRESIEQFGQYENMYTVGMRGLHDWPWQAVGAGTAEQKAEMLEEIIAAQRRILSETIGKRPEDIPQMFVPYKEILEVYNSGMRVPDDVTLMWTNDNYGYIRQLPTEQEKIRRGGNGMYYHLSYCGRPKSYLWLSTTPFSLIKEEMTKAYHNGVKQIWIANAGDIKAAERQMEFFLDLAWDVEGIGDIGEYISEKSQRDFGLDKSRALEFAKADIAFQRLAFARKPELFERDLFHLKAFNDEGQQYIDRYDKVLECSEKIYKELKEDKKTAYFELHLYALRSCRNTAYQYITMDEQKQHIEDGFKNAAENYIYLSDDGHYNIIGDTRRYYSIKNGKWKYIMDSAYGWFIERKHGYPLLECRKEWGEAGIHAVHEEMIFSGYTKDRRFIDVFNHCGLYAEWELSSDCEYIVPSRSNGVVISDERIWISIDYKKAPKKNFTATIFIKSPGSNDIMIPVKIENQCEELPAGTHVETCGYVSVMAKNMVRCTVGNGHEWRIEKYLGRIDDSLKAYAVPQLNGAAVAEYDVYFNSTGEFEADIYRIPTLDERNNISFGIGINDKPPSIVSCTNKYVDFSDGTDSWGKGVLGNCEMLTTRIKVTKTGMNTLKLYAAGGEVIIEKIVIWTKERVKSYFGPPESLVK